MTEIENITLQHLKAIRGDIIRMDENITKMNEKIDASTRNTGVLADGVLSIRAQLNSFEDTIKTVVMATAEHGHRLASVEDRFAELRSSMARIEQRLDRSH